MIINGIMFDPHPDRGAFSLMPYFQPLGFPLHWRDEEGHLKIAVEAYLSVMLQEATQSLSEWQIKLLRDYLVYYIDAPCWYANPFLDDAGRAEIAQLRVRARDIASASSIKRWTEEAMEVGIDPF